MIKGIGVDIVSISRIGRLLSSNHRNRFLQRVLHPSEISTLANIPQAQQSQYVAGSWAAKEAVFKALEPQKQRDFRFSQWYRYRENSKPCIASDGESDEYLLSISHDRDNLIAMVLRQERN